MTRSTSFSLHDAVATEWWLISRWVRRILPWAAGALGILTVAALLASWRYGSGLDAEAEVALAALPLVPIIAIGLWRADPPYSDSLQWQRPLPRAVVTSARFIAGLGWLFIGLTVVIFWIMGIALITGGALGAEETRLVSSSEGYSTGVRTVEWQDPAWLWLVPLSAAAIIFSLSNAFLLLVRNPLRVIASVVVFSITALLMAASVPEIAEGMTSVATVLGKGHLGLSWALSGGLIGSQVERLSPQLGEIVIWEALPDAEIWLSAMLCWLFAALLALATAITVHHRRR